MQQLKLKLKDYIDGRLAEDELDYVLDKSRYREGTRNIHGVVN